MSQANLLPGDIKTRKVAILAANGVDGVAIAALKKALEAEGAHAKLLGPTSAPVKTADGKSLPVDASMEGMPSIAFDAVFVPGGKDSVKALSGDGVALHFPFKAFFAAIGQHRVWDREPKAKAIPA